MKKTASRIGYFLLALTLAVALSACANHSASQPGTQDQSAANQKDQELTIALDWYPNAVHSFLYAAEEQGYFKQEHVKVNLQMPSDANDPLKMAAAGQVDAAISYQSQMIQARSEGVPVVSIAGLVYSPLNVLMVRKDSGIHSPKDLAGKTVGYPSVPLDEEIVKQMVKADGGDDSQIKFVDIGYDIIPSLTAKKVDAVIGGFINHEQLILEKNGVAVTAFAPHKYGVPNFSELVLATSDQTLSQKQQALQAFLRAAQKGQEYVAKHKEQSIDLLLNKQAKEFPLDKTIENKSLDILLPLMDAGGKPFGTQDPNSWQQAAEWMKQVGLIKTDVPVDQVMHNLTP
ncbi:ABC transporter substrate-binding protein [Brevibacillus ginsengisoli]|uniref:ABC transporter substrate-binding protein n=1 Tax=Brevibacillus ginsengisoli TaxID=363854 RepID=UPI003CF6CFE3